MITLLLLAAAAAYLLWPASKPDGVPQAGDLFPGWPPSPPATVAQAVEPAAAAPAARDAIDSLLEVRDRLAATDALDDDSAKAVDVLWLDLLHGSQRK